jgi:hypothetical protein
MRYVVEIGKVNERINNTLVDILDQTIGGCDGQTNMKTWMLRMLIG